LSLVIGASSLIRSYTVRFTVPLTMTTSPIQGQ
jgi:hypothetical protein